MSNGIATRQNEDVAIKYLAAQRQLYSVSKTCRTIAVILNGILTVVFSAILLIFKNEERLVAVLGILTIVNWIISSRLEKIQDKKNAKAAKIQQYFDVLVYQMPWDERLFDRKGDVHDNVSCYSEKLLKKADERDVLKN